VSQVQDESARTKARCKQSRPLQQNNCKRLQLGVKISRCACVLFGSQATGKVHAQSDVDLAIWPSQPLPTQMKLHWLQALEELIAQEVNLILVSPDLNPVLGFEIQRDGRLVFEREPELWQHRRAQLWHAYNDSLPFRRAAHQRLRQWAEEVLLGAHLDQTSTDNDNP